MAEYYRDLRIAVGFHKSLVWQDQVIWRLSGLDFEDYLFVRFVDQ